MIIRTLVYLRNHTWQLTLEDGRSLPVPDETVQNMHLEAGMTLTEEMWRKIRHAIACAQAYEMGLRFLRHRDHSVAQTRKKLLEAGHDAAAVEDVLVTLTDEGFLNDVRFAEEAAYHYVERQLYGIQLASYRMTQLGLENDTIRPALAPYADTEQDRLLTLMRGKFSRYFRDPDDKPQLLRGKRAVARYGYRGADIENATCLLLDERTKAREDETQDSDTL